METLRVIMALCYVTGAIGFFAGWMASIFFDFTPEPHAASSLAMWAAFMVCGGGVIQVRNW